jgi:hypothetical protein
MTVMQSSRLSSRPLVGRLASAGGLLRVVIAVLSITLVGNSIAYGQTAAAPNVTKQKLLEIGISNRLKVKEADGTTLKGTLSAVNEDSFLIIPKDGGAAVTILYTQAGSVARDGLSKGTKIAIWIVVGAVVVAGIIIAVAVEKFRSSF